MASTNKENYCLDINKTLHERAQKIKYGLIHTYNAKSSRENILIFIMDIQ